jgi:hypothetical protein
MRVWHAAIENKILIGLVLHFPQSLAKVTQEETAKSSVFPDSLPASANISVVTFLARVSTVGSRWAKSSILNMSFGLAISGGCFFAVLWVFSCDISRIFGDCAELVMAQI